MPPCVQAYKKTIVAVAAIASLAPCCLGPAPAEPALPSRLEQHALMLAAAARNSSAAGAPEQAARHIETALASQGHAVSCRDYRHQGQPMRQVEVTLSNPATVPPAARVLVVGAAHASSTRRRNNDETAAVIELARLLRHLLPAPGTELKFVFFVNAVSPDTGNFIAFAGSRASAESIRKTLSSFRATLPVEGLAAPAYVEGVTLLSHAAHGRHDDPALLITAIAFLHYPYSHTLQEATDYPGMARGVSNLAKLIAGIAAPPAM